MVTIDINKRKKKLIFLITRMEDQLKKIVWIFVVQTFLLFYLELLEKFCLFFKKSRLFLMKSSKVIPIYTILLCFPGKKIHLYF